MSKQQPTSTELLEWAMMMVAREQASGTYGKVIVHMERGVITRVERMKTELPSFPTPSPIDSASGPR